MAAYLRQIQKAVEFIEAHLHNELGAGVIARHAGISLWHFQRIFSGALAQPLMEYVRRRRLSVALEQLMTTKRSIVDIALDSGFESQEAFSRAFKAMFGKTPGRCRSADAKGLVHQIVPQITQSYITHLYRGITMTPTLETLPARTVAGIGGNFISALSPNASNFTVIPRLWEEFWRRSQEVPRRADAPAVGCVYCPAVADGTGEEGECHYLAGVEVEGMAAAEVPQGMEVREIPGGRYAVFVHKGKLDTIGQTMSYIYGAWLPKSGVELRDAPDLEIYGEKFNPGSEDSEMQICIPVKG